nr:hypothetical protein [Nocardia bovistercoris]
MDGIENLAAWLRGEHELAGRVRLSRAAPRPGEMGTLTDALIVSVGAGGALTTLAWSLRAWFAQPHRANVFVKVTGADNRVVEIDAESARTKDVQKLLATALEAGHAPRPANGLEAPTTPNAVEPTT